MIFKTPEDYLEYNIKEKNNYMNLVGGLKMDKFTN